MADITNPQMFPPPTPATTTVEAERPVSVTVFGILNIVFGAMGLLCTPLSLAMILWLPTDALQVTGGFRQWLFFSYGAGIAFAACQLALGIGLLGRKRWARQGSVVYAACSIGFGVLGMLVTGAALARGSLGLPPDAVPGYIGGLIGGMAGFIYPVLLWVFMTRPRAVAACTR